MRKKPLVLFGTEYKSRADAMRKLGLRDYSQLERIERYAAMGMSKKQALSHFFAPSPASNRRNYFKRVLEEHGFWKSEN